MFSRLEETQARYASTGRAGDVSPLICPDELAGAETVGTRKSSASNRRTASRATKTPLRPGAQTQAKLTAIVAEAPNYLQWNSLYGSYPECFRNYPRLSLKPGHECQIQAVLAVVWPCSSDFGVAFRYPIFRFFDDDVLNNEPLWFFFLSEETGPKGFILQLITE